MNDEVDPRLPSRDVSVLEPVLERAARTHPDRVFAVFADGSSWTYGDTYDAACRSAAALHQLGVSKGDTVLSWLPNGGDALRVWFGANFLGAVYTPINTAYRGHLLEHVITNAGSKLLVTHGELLPRLDGLATGQVEQVLYAGNLPDDGTRLPARPIDALLHAAPDFDRPEEPVQPWDDDAVIYTSGTTGPSKGVQSTYIHLYEGVRAAYAGCGVTASDRYMLQVPLFHHGGIIGTYAMAVLGGSIAMVPGFDSSTFWQVIRRHEITVCALLGSMATFLWQRERRADDADNPLRLVYMAPLVGDVRAFSERFGVTVRTMFGMTETSCPLISQPNSTAIGSCGRPRAGIEVRIVDEHDRELPPGEVGELIVRADVPWSMSTGYRGMPGATAAAWRNGWFHTGDAFRRDADDNHYFVDRVQDYIRRRGENISSFELEAEVMEHHSVQEAAAVAVPSPYGEDDVLLVVTARPGATIDPLELLQFLVPRLPHFMVPRYVRVVDELPKTPTARVQKHRLRTEGVTASTFDREAVGFHVRRDPIGSPSNAQEDHDEGVRLS